MNEAQETGLVVENRVPATVETYVRNFVDVDGNPAGGCVRGIGFNINWQDGPRGQDAEGQPNPPSGAMVEDLLDAVIQRLEFYQRSEFACIENDMALKHLRMAREFMEERNVGRAARGVEGLNKK